MEGLRQKAMDERLRGMDGIDRRVRQLITLRVACVCPHTDSTRTPRKRRKGDGAPSAAATAAAAEGGKVASLAPRDRREGAGAPRGLGTGKESVGRRSGLPPILAVLKVWAPNEATAGLLLEGTVLRLHSVTASACRHRLPGCSLELSAGRQTKIEVIGTAAPGAGTGYGTAVSASGGRGVLDPGGERTPFLTPRFVPRRWTPLSALVPPPLLRGSRRLVEKDEGGCGAGHLRGGSGSGSGSDSASAGRCRVHGGDEEEEEVWARSTAPLSAGGEVGDGSAAGGSGGGGGGAEVDVVGCVFAVTVERSPLSSTPGSGEVFATAESIVHAADSAGRAGGGGSGSRDESGNEKNASTTAQTDDERVTYRVYMTEPSGACAVLTKRVRPELARHHRILRSAPGACWAIVNAGRHNGGCQTTPGSPCRERAPLLERRIDDDVIGFVSSFAVLPGLPSAVVTAGARPGYGDITGGSGGGSGSGGCGGGDTSMPDGLAPGCLWMGIDTGGGLAAAVLPRDSLKELLGVALGGGNGGRSLRPAALGPEERAGDGKVETTTTSAGSSSDDVLRALLDRAVAVAAAALGHDETTGREGGGRGATQAARSTGVTIGDGAPASPLPSAVRIASEQQARRPPPSVAAAPSPPPVTDSDDPIPPADSGDGPTRQRGAEVVASTETVSLGVSSTKAGRSERQGGGQQRTPHAAVVSSDCEAAIIDALASALCRMAHPSRRQGLGYSGSAGGGPSVRRNVSPAVAISGHVEAPPVVAAGVAEGPRPGAAASDVTPSADCSAVAGPTTAEGSGIKPGSRGFDGVKAASAGGVASAAPSVAASVGGDSGGGVRCDGVDATEAILDDLASACGRKELTFSVSRFFSRVLGREVPVVDGVSSVDVARSAEALLNDLGGSGASPPS
ncbi:unnamed protein product [Ectocarpus fasciculatus]